MVRRENQSGRAGHERDRPLACSCRVVICCVLFSSSAENLHHSIKKPAVVSLCEELVADGDLQVKDFKKVRMYMAKQLDSDAVSPEELDALTQRESQVKDRLADQKATNAKLDLQIRQLQNEPSDEELAKQLKEYAKTIDTLNAKLARFKTDKNPVTKVRPPTAHARSIELPCLRWYSSMFSLAWLVVVSLCSFRRA